MQKAGVSGLEHRVTVSNFTRFYFDWYLKILNCLSATELWPFEEFINGFVNKFKMKDVLLSLPRIESSKVFHLLLLFFVCFDFPYYLMNFIGCIYDWSF